MLNLAFLSAGLAATASAFDCRGPYFSFFNRGGSAMSYQRLDPALFPGTESPHLHSFDGGNGLTADMTFDKTQSSSCSTARVKTDKSLYWRPTLFWNGNDTGFYRVPEKYSKVYYKFGDAGLVRANVTEFPEGFSMIAGSPFQRSEGDNPAGVNWACLGDNYSRIGDTPGFPNGFSSCKEGLAVDITFPSCWNGKSLDPENPSAHMAWPTAGGTGLDSCPDGFKTARFPEIFIEFFFDVSSFDGQYSENDNPWVLSNGDPTGYGFHADFYNGWEKGVLGKATAETGYCDCGCGCGNEQMKTCFGAENVNDDGDVDFDACAAEATYGDGDTSVLDKLPGCNPIQSGPADATVVSGPDCNATPAPESDKTVAASSPVMNEVPVSSKIVSSAASSDKAVSISADVKSAETDAFPALTINFPNKHVDSGSQPEDDSDYEMATPTAEAFTTSNESAPAATLSASLLATSVESVESVASPADGEDECRTPVYITITPTVYVTANSVANTTSCESGTVYQTLTQNVTVTVPPVAPSDGSYKHKRHGRHHHKF